jgi:hypothetical protein
LEGLAMEDVGIFYGHLVHFTIFCYILWTFGLVCKNLVYFYRFGILYEEKSGNSGQRQQQKNILSKVGFDSISKLLWWQSRKMKKSRIRFKRVSIIEIIHLEVE